MKSRDLIKQELIKIASNHGYEGEIVDVASDLISYALYHSQLDIINTAKEHSLTTAKLLNSKISECMDVMYSVYRGKNAGIILNIINNTVIRKSRFDKIYESNTFNLYCLDNIDLIPDAYYGNDTPHQLRLFFSKQRYDYETEITSTNKYYIDALDSDGHPLEGLSEYVKVTIDEGSGPIEYPTTRNFYEHINSPVPLDPADPLDKIFVLTATDYGIRIFKRGYRSSNGDIIGYFKEGTKVHITAFSNMTLEDVNLDEVNRVSIQGTELKLIENKNVTDLTKQGKLLIPEIPAEDQNSILYNANQSTRTQSKILSNSDIAHLFTEEFIDRIQAATHRLDTAPKTSEDYRIDGGEIKIQSDTLNIFYLPKIEGDFLPKEVINNFKTKYQNYFLVSELNSYPVQLCTINLILDIYLNSFDQINEELENVIKFYENRITTRSHLSDNEFKSGNYRADYDYYEELVDLKRISSYISKIPQVDHINRIEVDSLSFSDQRLNKNYNPPYDRLPTSVISTYLVNGEEVKVRTPISYKFNLITSYRNSYEIISK